MAELARYLVDHRGEVTRLLAEHVVLVLIAVSAAALIGLPLGIVATRSRRLERPILGAANIVQTIPSLALFGFLIPLPFVGGVGARPAIVALTLYALLPIARNTHAGIRAVDPALIEAGRGMGMTDRQLLLRVELPLAAGVILAGVRVATVVSVGVATIAAAIGAGGLGVFIFRGIAMVDNVVILAGAVPAALLALVADALLGALERRLTGPGDRARAAGGAQAGVTRAWGALVVALGVTAAAAIAVSCGRHDAVVVGGKDFLEQDVLAEVVAQELEARGVPVERRLHLGGTHLAHRALTSGEIDLYVEYTGTALVEILDHAPLRDPEQAYGIVEREYRDRWDLVTAPPLGFENTFAFVVRRGDADSLGLAGIGDLSPLAPRWTIGVGPEFLDRADGFRGVTAAYGLDFGAVRQMDLGLLYRALEERRVDVVVGNSTDGPIAALGLVVLRDDRRFFPPYQAVPIVRRGVLERYPAVGDALRSLGGAIPAETMRRLNREVVEGADVGTVVRRWRAGRSR